MATEPSHRVRPFFLPEDLDFESLPANVQVAIDEIVAPAYGELVLGARSELERSSAISFVFLLTEEIQDQFEVAQQFPLGSHSGQDSSARHKRMRQHLRLVDAKLSAGTFIL